MKKQSALYAISPMLFILLLFNSCQHTNIENQIEQLPELPAELAATLDSNTLATKVKGNANPCKEESKNPLLAPCCSRTNYKSLKVLFSYTKCAPLRDFIMVPFDDLSIATTAARDEARQEKNPPQIYKYGKKASIGFDQIVCITREGPWEALLIEDQPCAGYFIRHQLIINAFGDQIVYSWCHGLENHPPEVQLVSCRYLYTLKSSCGVLSNCDCFSDFCPPEDPCNCDDLPW